MLRRVQEEYGTVHSRSHGVMGISLFKQIKPLTVDGESAVLIAPGRQKKNKQIFSFVVTMNKANIYTQKR